MKKLFLFLILFVIIAGWNYAGSSPPMYASDPSKVTTAQTITVDSETAHVIEKADGTDVLIVDTTNSRIGINGTPEKGLHILSGDMLLDNAQKINWKNAAGTSNTIIQYGSGDALVFGDGVTSASAMTLDTGNLLLGTSTFGTNAKQVFIIETDTAPTTNPANLIQMWSADYAAGDARLYIMGEGSTDKVIIGRGDIEAANHITGTTAYFSTHISSTQLKITEGTNAYMGTVTLVAGSGSVTTTAVASDSRIYMTVQTGGGTVGSPYIVQRTAGVGFHVSSTSATDTSDVAWIIISP